MNNAARLLLMLPIALIAGLAVHEGTHCAHIWATGEDESCTVLLHHPSETTIGRTAHTVAPSPDHPATSVGADVIAYGLQSLTIAGSLTLAWRRPA